MFITGISGFAGASLVRYFSNRPDVKLYGHSRNVSSTNEKYGQYNVELVTSYSAELLNSLGIDYIIHLAGIAHDLSNQYTPSDYDKVNFLNTREIYEHFLHSGVKKFVFISSIKAVVDHAEYPVREESNSVALTPYGCSKRKAEEYILGQNLPEGKHYYILRPCMIHGPGNKGNLNLLYRYVKSGLPYPLGAFQNQRSFLNAANFNFYIDQILNKDIPEGIYNLSDVGTLSTREIVKLIALTLGKRPRIWNLPIWLMRMLFNLYNKNMLPKLTENMVVPNDKLLAFIEQNPPVTIEDGVRQTIRSFEE